MQLKEVQSTKDWKQFFKVPEHIYRDDEDYIPHIRQDIRKIFSVKNPEAEKGKYKLWFLLKGKIAIGRIAAFYGHSHHAGIGFFECINEIEAANLLFEAAENFLKSHGNSYVEAPVNYGERDRYWGLLIKMQSRPSYQENYNPPYYKHLFENRGYHETMLQSTQEINPDTFNLNLLSKLEDRWITRPGFKIERINKKHLPGFAVDFAEIYNDGWQHHEHFEMLNTQDVLELMKMMRPVMREDLIWFTYLDEEPVGFYASLPDVNQIFCKLNGNMNWFGKLKFLWFRNRIHVDRIRGIAFGVKHRFQGTAIFAPMIMQIYRIILNDPFLKSAELSWVGDFNPKMLALIKQLGARETKVHATYGKKL
ncbi:MAG: hypothetical protein GC181_04925 [Bacteroidetes bacterium]|nr:hypothetical protein [Bacteroidota bacterium]